MWNKIAVSVLTDVLCSIGSRIMHLRLLCFSLICSDISNFFFKVKFCIDITCSDVRLVVLRSRQECYLQLALSRCSSTVSMSFLI